jgi:hypothetical protein
MNNYLIRFNTKHNGSKLVWRVFENGTENLVENIDIRVPVFTESSREAGETKWNISCSGEMKIVNDVAYIRDSFVEDKNLGSLDQYDDPAWHGVK